ncbi:MAG: Trk system potassium transporter TrkA [Lachnospiraceae bacterium]|nr:Trk system potassium transporter TrkA [Lachnospiraceae bacterium]
MKILIAGNGKVGITLTRHLSAEGYDLTLIDLRPQVLETCMESFDVMGIAGNCASMDTLREAGVNEADLLIAMTGYDELNLLCCMTAHFMNPKLHTIARIKNPEYASQFMSMRQAFALSMIVNPDFMAAREINRLLKYPGFLKRDTFARGNVEIVELKINEDSKLSGLVLHRLGQVFRCQILVCAVLRNGEVVIPSGNFTLSSGDRIFVTGSQENLTILLHGLGVIPHPAKRVLIAGGSRISNYLATILLKTNMSVHIIESDEKRCRELSALLPNATVVHGDASDQNLLNREGLSNCDAFVTMTGVDEANIIMSLYGSHCKVPQIITKLGRAENMQLLSSLPIGSIISPRELCCNAIVRYVRAMQNLVGAAVTVHSVADGQAEAIEFIADENTPHCNEPLKTLKFKKNVLLAGITRKGRTEIPSGDSRYQIGDSLVVVSAGEVIIRQLGDIFEL